MITLLATNEMLATRPKGVEIVQDWGEISIYHPAALELRDYSKEITGHHIAVEGDQEAIKDWLRPYDGVWVGIGSPMMQEFEVMHIK